MSESAVLHGRAVILGDMKQRQRDIALAIEFYVLAVLIGGSLVYGIVSAIIEMLS